MFEWLSQGIPQGIPWGLLTPQRTLPVSEADLEADGDDEEYVMQELQVSVALMDSVSSPEAKEEGDSPAESEEKERAAAEKWTEVQEEALRLIDEAKAKKGSQEQPSDVTVHAGMAWGNIWNWVQVLSIVINAVEPIYGFATTEVGWLEHDLLSAGSSGDGGGVTWMSYVALGVGVCYPVYALYGVGLVMRNRLGVNEDGTIFSFLSWQGFYINGLTILSSTLYFPILESLLAAFPCEYLQTEGANGSMINQTEGANGFSQTMEAALGFGGGACYGRAHLAYMVGAGLALLMYYPLASFVFPNLQFADKLLDLKFEPSFLVMFQQTRLLMAAAASWYPDAIMTRLLVALLTFLLLAYLNQRMQPCLVHSVNIWRTVEFLLSAAICATSLLLYGGVVDRPKAFICVGASAIVLMWVSVVPLGRAALIS